MRVVERSALEGRHHRVTEARSAHLLTGGTLAEHAAGCEAGRGSVEGRRESTRDAGRSRSIWIGAAA
jgi:hypothetical protein